MMEMISTENKPQSYPVISKLVTMIRMMLAFEPIMMNAIAISLGFGVLLLLGHPSLFPKMGKYHLYLTYAIYVLITLQTIKSATKSLLIPLAAMAIAGIGYIILSLHPDLKILSIEVLKKLMLLGVIGVATSIFVIR